MPQTGSYGQVQTSCWEGGLGSREPGTALGVHESAFRWKILMEYRRIQHNPRYHTDGEIASKRRCVAGSDGTAEPKIEASLGRGCQCGNDVDIDQGQACQRCQCSEGRRARTHPHSQIGCRLRFPVYTSTCFRAVNIHIWTAGRGSDDLLVEYIYAYKSK